MKSKILMHLNSVKSLSYPLLPNEEILFYSAQIARVFLPHFRFHSKKKKSLSLSSKLHRWHSKDLYSAVHNEQPSKVGGKYVMKAIHKPLKW